MKTFQLVLATVLISMCFSSAFGTTLQQRIYVSHRGGGTGMAPESTLTLLEAQEKARELIREGLTGNIEVCLVGGRYELDEALKINENDAGNNGHYVIYRNAPGEKPIISGGKKLQHWYKEGDLFVCNIPDGFEPRMLYIDGEPALRARYPNVGSGSEAGLKDWHFRVPGGNGSGYTVNIYPYDKANNRLDITQPTTGTLADNLPPVINFMDFNNYHNANEIEFVLTAKFNQARYFVDRVEKSGDKEWLYFRDPTDVSGYESVIAIRNQPFYFDNAIEFIDMDREWAISRHDKKIYLKSSENPNNLEIIAPHLENLIDIEDTEFIGFYGVSFEHSAYHYTNKHGTRNRLGGVRRQQATDDEFLLINHKSAQGTSPYYPPLEAAIKMDRSRNIFFENNTIRNTEAVGLRLDSHMEKIAIIGNHFYHTGGSAIVADSIFAVDTDSYIREVNIINNYFHDLGCQMDGGAMAVVIFWPTYVRIEHNMFENITGWGIHMGWYASRNIKRYSGNIISYNHFSNVCTWSTDAGCIHTKSGTAEGALTLINYRNYFHNLDNTRLIGNYRYSGGAHAKVFYFDDASSRILSYKNYVDESTIANTDFFRVTPLSGQTIRLEDALVRIDATTPEDINLTIEKAGLQDEYLNIASEDFGKHQEEYTIFSHEYQDEYLDIYNTYDKFLGDADEDLDEYIEFYQLQDQAEFDSLMREDNINKARKKMKNLVFPIE